MTKFFILTLLISFYSCNKEEPKINKSLVGKDLSFTTETKSMSAEDDFSDLKKKEDESCADEEELKKKLIQKKPKAFQLQGGDAGCDIEGAESIAK